MTRPTHNGATKTQVAKTPAATPLATANDPVRAATEDAIKVVTRALRSVPVEELTPQQRADVCNQIIESAKSTLGCALTWRMITTEQGQTMEIYIAATK